MHLFGEIRPQVIPLTDAFNFTDYTINSPLGCTDGDVYRRMFERVTSSNPPQQPHAYFEDVLKPVLLRPKVLKEAPPESR